MSTACRRPGRCTARGSRELIAHGRALRAGSSGQVVFKAELGRFRRRRCQVQGVWVAPQCRARAVGRRRWPRSSRTALAHGADGDPVRQRLQPPALAATTGRVRAGRHLRDRPVLKCARPRAGARGRRAGTTDRRPGGPLRRDGPRGVVGRLEVHRPRSIVGPTGDGCGGRAVVGSDGRQRLGRRGGRAGGHGYAGGRAIPDLERPRAAHVDPVPAHPARGPGRRRGAEPPAARARRLHPPRRRRASSPGCRSAAGATATSSASSARRWTPPASRRCTSRRCCRASPTRRPAAGPSTATTCSGCRTARAPTTCSAPPTRRCSPCWSRASTPPTRTCRCRSTRSRPSTATRPGRAPGILRGREFVMKDSYSFDIDDAGLQASYERAPRRLHQRPSTGSACEYVIVSAHVRGDGRLGQRGVPRARATSARTPSCAAPSCDYAANVEAVTRPSPPADRRSTTAPPRTSRTPRTPPPSRRWSRSSNDASYPRADRPWTAADTLKNVVVQAAPPRRHREPLAIGLPGDREVDMKRLEAAAAPGRGRALRGGRLRARTRRWSRATSGPACSARTGQSGIRYLVDPRVVDRHRAGSPAPTSPAGTCSTWSPAATSRADGTHRGGRGARRRPVPDVRRRRCVIARGIEIGHIFQLGRKYAEALGAEGARRERQARVVTMGSYGIGVSRAVAAIAEQTYDEQGLVLAARGGAGRRAHRGHRQGRRGLRRGRGARRRARGAPGSRVLLRRPPRRVARA